MVKNTVCKIPCCFSGTFLIPAYCFGLDTSHVIAFTNTINDMPASSDYEGFKVVGAWPAMWVKSVYLPYTISHASLPVPQEA